MISDIVTLPEDPAELKNQIITLSQHYEKEVRLLKEQIRFLQDKLFGRRSEKSEKENCHRQLSLLDDFSDDAPSAPEETVDVPAHKRRKNGRKPLPESLPRIEVIHDLSDEEKLCECGCLKERIGEESSEQLDIIPARMQVIRNIRYKYACKNCEGVESDQPTVMIAPLPEQLIPKSKATAGLLAHIMTAKFVDALPFYRQEKQFKRLGVEISRTDMCGWAMKIADKCLPLLEISRNELLSGPLIQVDETTLKVLAERDRSKSYMWLFRGGPPDKPTLVYKYHATRSGDVAATYLRGYKGYVQTDGYAGYDFLDRLPGIHHVGCWAHARRKFVEVTRSTGKKRGHVRKKGNADEALAFIRELYKIEKGMRQLGLSVDEVCKQREEKALPILAQFKKWLDIKSPMVPPKSLLGKAINYALNQWDRLVRYTEQGYLTPDNNLAENAIRPFVVGRKNWLFSGNAKGAKASAVFFSLIETAKANGLEPYIYLRYLFEKLPTLKATDGYKALLPQYLDEDQLKIPA
jgi:transposase